LIVDPAAPPAQSVPKATRALTELRGKVVAFVDNTKPNFDALAEDIGEILLREHGVARVIRHRKRAPSCGATDLMLEDMERNCDLVIAGSGD
jgi:hypothetical protein